MGVLCQAIQDCTGIGAIADLLVPTGRRELTGYKGRAPTISVCKDFGCMVSGFAVEDKQIDAGEALPPPIMMLPLWQPRQHLSASRSIRPIRIIV